MNQEINQHIQQLVSSLKRQSNEEIRQNIIYAIKLNREILEHPEQMSPQFEQHVHPANIKLFVDPFANLVYA